MFLIIGKPKTILDLKNQLKNGESIDRKLASIAIIDDEPFIYKDILRRHDFNIREIGDPNDIKAVESYNIILCDIKGVGKHFKSPFEGGHIIREIKKKYPSKIIVAYTGQQFDPSYNQFYELTDFTVKKDISNDDWVDLLDKAVKRFADPVQQWIRLRDLLIKHEVTSIHLMRLEDEFVKKFLGQTDKFPSKNIMKSLTPEIKSILNSYLSSLIFKATIGI